MSEPARDSVDSGYCRHPKDGGFTCSLTAGDCRGNATFFTSSFALAEMPNNPPGKDCTLSRQTQRTRIGQCDDGKDSGHCASVPVLCEKRSQYKALSSDCTVKQNRMLGEPTKYGSCKSKLFPNEDKTCLWDDVECNRPATFAVDNDCTCDKVRVGACRKINQGAANVVYCAVNEQACEAGHEFLSVAKLVEIGRKDCYLCREGAVPAAPNSAPTPNTDRQPTRQPGRTPSNNKPTFLHYTIQPDSGINITNIVHNNDLWDTTLAPEAMKSGPKVGSTISSVVGGITGVVLFALAVVGFLKYRKATTGKESALEASRAEVVTTASVESKDFA